MTVMFFLLVIITITVLALLVRKEFRLVVEQREQNRHFNDRYD